MCLLRVEDVFGFTAEGGEGGFKGQRDPSQTPEGVQIGCGLKNATVAVGLFGRHVMRGPKGLFFLKMVF